MNITGMIIMIDMMRRRAIFTDPEEKQNINPWKMKLLSCLTLGVLAHNSYCVWIMSTSDFYLLHNPRGLQIGAIIANICEMSYFLMLVIFIHSMGRESLIETTRVRMYTSFILAVIA